MFSSDRSRRRVDRSSEGRDRRGVDRLIAIDRGAGARRARRARAAGVRDAGRMFCAISGAAPAHPVVTPRGVLYERSLIVKAIEVRARTRRRRERAMGRRARVIASNGALRGVNCDARMLTGKRVLRR